MRPGGPTIANLLCTAAERGVGGQGPGVALATWTSCSFSEEENQRLGERIEEAGGEVLLDPAGPYRRLAPSEASRAAAPSRTGA